MTLRIVPVSLAEANRFIEHVHRHNGSLPSAKLAVALIEADGTVRGVAIAGIPKARMLLNRGTMEVSRVGTDGVRNGCSMLYAAMVRACRGLGYSRLVTYTLASEGGASLKASGWREVASYPGGSWSARNASKGNHAYRDAHDTGPKVRWEIECGPPVPELRWPANVAEEQLSMLDLLDGGAA